MPMKTCKKCQHKCGPRSLYCPACKAPYINTLKAFGHIEQKNSQSVVVNNNINFSVSQQNKVPIPNFRTEDISLDPKHYFDHLVDRENQSNVLLSAARTAIESNFKIRNHVCLTGPACGGKTSLMESFSNTVGEDYIFRIDAPTSTQAGLVLDLLERAASIRFLLVEEIEKVNSDHLRWLLGVMDERAEIRVCNAKSGYIQAPLPAMVIATCNDQEKLDKVMTGALSSRFSNKIYCPRIGRETMHKALKRYVDMINGDENWIEPAIAYCLDEEKCDDLRRMKAVLTEGRSRLLTGEYQSILRATRN